MSNIAVDAMSGENDPQAAVAASLRMAVKRPDMNFFLCGDKAKIAPLLGDAPDNVNIVEAAEVAGMSELPSRAIRRRDTSMRRAMELVAEGRAQAVVSAGNTGALLGIGLLVLRAASGVQRPAIASFMPNPNFTGGCCMLDLGANVECSAAMLRQFALMGGALTTAVRGVKNPRVGLLNIGEENFKGNGQVREAAAMLKKMPSINFIGNVEGNDIYLGDCEVIVCDGFTGNVALKTSEGLARMISGMIKNAFARNVSAKICGALASPVLSRLRTDMDARRYNGACFLGLRGVVVKSHGNADDTAFFAALEYAVCASRHNLAGIIEAMPLLADAP